jgi:hypothetical protein
MIGMNGIAASKKGRCESAKLIALLFPFAFFLFVGGAGYPAPRAQNPPGEEEPPEKLSAYGLFAGNGSTQEPVAGVLPYDLNTPLFSDHAAKYRFIKLPAGTGAKYHETDVFDFPVGTIFSKTFAFLND